MAPSLDHDKEPKAPDKNHSSGADSPHSDVLNYPSDSQEHEESVGLSVDPERSGELESLDEGQLRTLLDEAATYRRPKDREGKSLLFKELLQKAEQDSEAEWGPQCYRRTRRSLGGGVGRRSGARPPLTHSGSLQDLAEGGGAGGGVSSSVVGGGGGRSGVGLRSKHRQGRASKQVSARSQQGGSLPSNVDQQHNLCIVEGRRSFLEDVRCGGSGGGDYIATVHCVNPPTEYYYSRHRPDSPLHNYYTTEDLDIRSQASSHVSVNYTSRATLEIGSPALDTEKGILASTNSSSCSQNNTRLGSRCEESSNLSAPFSCLETVESSTQAESPNTSSPLSSGGSGTVSTCPLQLASNYCSVKSVVGDEVPVSAMSPAGAAATTTVVSSVSHPITTASPASSHLNILATCNVIPRISYQPAKLDAVEFKKCLDENGNSVNPHTINAVGGSTKKCKRKKCKNETETLSDNIIGYRGKEDINDILKFIESDVGEGGKNTNKGSNAKSNPSLNSKPSGKEGKSKDDSHEKSSKKRSTDRKIKDGVDKLKKSNSMEELSRRKLDDLTSSSRDHSSVGKSKKHWGFQQSDGSDMKRNDRRSWGNDGSDSYYHEDILSVNSSSPHSVTGPNVKAKKTKSLPYSTWETEPSVLVVETLESADFQTVTNKKKIRKRHSPADEGRGAGKCSSGGLHKGGRFNSSLSNNHERDSFRKTSERKQTSVSSPQSDSNDDLESIHSLSGEMSVEKLQASYADMARAAQRILPAPATSPPPSVPPPNLVTSPPQRLQHNFPDLIESCNYYSNQRTLQDKYLDVSSENNKNLMHKEHTLLTGDSGNSHVSYPTYNHEQYPALEPKQRPLGSSRNTIHRSNSTGGVGGASPSSGSAKAGSGGGGDVGKVECAGGECILAHQHQGSMDYYVAYVEHTAANSSGGDCYIGTDDASHNQSIPQTNSGGNKPPDVVLPITHMDQAHHQNDVRPPVIILNEELKKSCGNAPDIDGITFGFDINEQLLNGSIEKSVEEERETNGNGRDVGQSGVTRTDNCDLVFSDTRLTTMLIYNSSEFPPIRDHPVRDVLHVGCGKSLALRYLPPPDVSHTSNLDRLVHYVGTAWENAIKSPGGKVRYFSE